MITHKEIPGGGGGEARPDGRYVSNMRDGSALVITDGARLECPPGSNVLYPRVTPIGEFKIIGQCSPDNCHSTYEWRAGVGWVDVGESIGVSPAIYDYAGRLFMVTPGGPYGTSQGFRYVTLPNPTFPGGMVVLGDHTMSAAPDGRLIHEYTQFGGGYTGGQGHDEGTHIVTPDGHRFILSHGDNRFTRWTYDPGTDTLAIAISNLSRQSVEFWWMRLADIYTLEAFVPPIGPRPPDPPKPVAPPKFTIASPTFPQAGTVPFSVTCVYADEAGGGALDWIEWLSGASSTGPWVVEAQRPGTEHAYTYPFGRAGTTFIKARGGNKAGTHETGAERKVTVTEPVPPIIPPEPPIEPPVTDHYRLATVHGGYLAVGADHVLLESSVATPFEVVDAETHVGLKAPSGFVAAEPDGRLIANRGTIGDWERFTQTALADGRWQFQSDAWETYISAHDDGTVRADQSVAGGWETFTPSAAPPSGGGGTGVELVITGQFYSTATGEPWHGIEATDFNLVKLSMLDPSAAEAVIAQRAEIGFTLLRVWMLNHSVLGDLDPTRYPQMYDTLAALIPLANGYGVCLEVTAFTSTQGLLPNPDDQRTHWRRVCDVVRGQRNVILEPYNEGDQWDNLPTITLTKPDGVICSRGSNGSDSIPPHHDDPWDEELYHILGDQWQRKTGHNAMEWANESRRPCRTNESQRFVDNDSNPVHAYDSAAGGALLCAGTCFHSQQGKLSQMFDGQTLVCAQAFVDGARSVPLEYRTGAYRHETGRENAQILRSYSRTLGDGRTWYVDIRY